MIVDIQDFISPTITDRLEIDTPLLKARIPDWRAMVAVVLINAAYNGQVINITLSDVPEKKDDLSCAFRNNVDFWIKLVYIGYKKVGREVLYRLGGLVGMPGDNHLAAEGFYCCCRKRLGAGTENESIQP
jgi:hypothetical protein